MPTRWQLSPTHYGGHQAQHITVDTNPNTMETKPNTLIGTKPNTLQRLREIKLIPINVIMIFQQIISYDPLFFNLGKYFVPTYVGCVKILVL